MFRRPSILAALAALAAALAASPALAHEASGDRAMGTVASVSAERLVVRARDGHEVAFKVTPGTRFTRGEDPAGPGDVRVGERAVVQGKRAGDEVEAVRVKLGAAPRKKGR